ncbi:Pentatricopeptide repeat-containing protein [Cardamine amara subsp. amara]|uniref:Pentatricopeptide repeat-containing protein n=1 Tax=Cardamine amara subsp. amara TaxID=228776 RepID=A0ABD1BDA9_CARAN
MLVSGLCVNGETEKAVALFKEIIDIKTLDGDGLRNVYGIVVRGFCKEKKMEAAERFIFQMEETGIGPIIDRHCKNMNLPEALGFLDQMLGKGLKINCVIVSSILQCYCKMGMCLEELQKFKEF